MVEQLRNGVEVVAVECAVYPQFSHAEKLVLLCRLEVDYFGAHCLRLTGRFLPCHRHAVSDIRVFLFVYLHQRLTAQMFRHSLHGFLCLCFGDPGVERLECNLEVAHQQHLAVALSAQCAIGTNLLGIP